jgi:hypothetical protein
MSLDAERILVLALVFIVIVVVIVLHRSGKSGNKRSDSD